ncbi:F0F1 ATP synthase subunit gamma [Bacteroides caecigallinarum]|uniref:F0F1 ATP synthase subunit gamma n=1 Tax=Bacteroides caecigallinarum TaxID=1411144 RepID=UPI001F2F0602|nr:F0F1 ATP synthase subunit gamma [Bacteroides caecigallinarum]MCF2552458.1 F0F1 ATP synthase subunit gamma [Bacteroides caecigallinarum]
MASLKEVKSRINSINGTLKITSAMKMVASAKLHKAQEAIENMLPYENKLHGILRDFLASGVSVQTPFSVNRQVKKVAIVAFASNSSLCGGYNANVIRHLSALVDEYSAKVGKENILIYPVGRKIAEAVKKMGLEVAGDYQHMSGKPNYQDASDLASELMDKFLKGEIQKVDLLYNHFKSTSSQILTHETYLPVDVNGQVANADNHEAKEHSSDYIIEPSAEVIMKSLVLKVLRMKIYTVLLDAAASEHAARTMAMQIATDNANDLIQELTLVYNKSRQQAITNELLDIVGGTMA